MVNICPDIPKDSRYSIQEAAAILGIHRDTLRRHTDLGLIKCGLRRTSSRRFYLGSEITRYWKSMY